MPTGLYLGSKLNRAWLPTDISFFINLITFLLTVPTVSFMFSCRGRALGNLWVKPKVKDFIVPILGKSFSSLQQQQQQHPAWWCNQPTKRIVWEESVDNKIKHHIALRLCSSLTSVHLIPNLGALLDFVTLSGSGLLRGGSGTVFAPLGER